MLLSEIFKLKALAGFSFCCTCVENGKTLGYTTKAILLPNKGAKNFHNQIQCWHTWVSHDFHAKWLIFVFTVLFPDQLRQSSGAASQSCGNLEAIRALRNRAVQFFQTVEKLFISLRWKNHTNNLDFTLDRGFPPSGFKDSTPNIVDDSFDGKISLAYFCSQRDYNPGHCGHHQRLLSRSHDASYAVVDPNNFHWGIFQITLSVRMSLLF